MAGLIDFIGDGRVNRDGNSDTRIAVDFVRQDAKARCAYNKITFRHGSGDYSSPLPVAENNKEEQMADRLKPHTFRFVPSLAGVAFLLFAVAAHAQTSVTLYGVTDSYVSYDHGGAGSSYQLSSGAGSTSRFGLVGNEDLGGGLSAGFRLESGFNIQNGTMQVANTPFNREANVWLHSDRYGELKLGRQFPTIFPLDSNVDPFALTKLSLTAQMFYAAADLGGNASAIDSRVSSAISYTTPSIGGFSVQGLYAFNVNTSGVPAHMEGLVAQYDERRLYAGVSYNKVRDAMANGTDHYSAGVAYHFGEVIASLAYNRIVPDSAGGRIASSYQIGTIVPWRTFNTFKGEVVYRRVQGNGAGGSIGALLGYEYALSKRTSLYSRVGYIDNGSDSAMTDDATVAVDGENVFVAAFGVTHRF